MASELTELAALAAENVQRERGNESIQTFLDDWADRLEVEARLAQGIAEIDFAGEPRRWKDVVSYGKHAVIGFLVKKSESSTDERTIFS